MAEFQEEFQIFVKPAGAKCNLHCSYCYYLSKESLYASGSYKIMPEDILEEYIVQHFKACPGPDVFFSWHGGEPLLAGIEFYRKAVELENKHKPESFKVYNGIQTNGLLINDKWCRFLAENNFYVGISMDGPEEFHNAFRIYSNGKPSFNKVLEGFRLLQKYNIRNEILCVVSSANVSKPLEIYRFFKSLDARFITFLPLVIMDLSKPGHVHDISVPAEEFGRFLCKIFDEWVAEDIGRIKIQIFEEAVRPAFGQEHSLCIFKKVCGRVPVIELNGDFYSCDHFVDPEHHVGNIMSHPVSVLLNSEKQRNFGMEKLRTLPEFCIQCDVREMCNGECPKNRFIKTPDGEPGLNYLCPGYRIFFRHIKPFVEAVGAEWRRRNR
ncbi:MAG: anaerobic sulfatase maturase [Bacteroidales bacterium]